MEPEEIQCLNNNRRTIVDRIVLNADLWNELRAKELVTEEVEATIKINSTVKEQVGRLLDHIQKGRPGVLQLFCECLRATNQEHVADLLCRPDEPKIPVQWSVKHMPDSKIPAGRAPPTFGAERDFYEKLLEFNRDNLSKQQDQGGYDLSTHTKLTLCYKHFSDVEAYHGFRELVMHKAWGNEIEPEHLFGKLQDDSNPRSVLMIGAQGVGKTATCLFFLQEVLNNRLWNSEFNFVFFVFLRELGHIQTEISFQDLIFNCFGPSLPSRKEQDQVWKYLESHQEEILFILDGADEIMALDMEPNKNLMVPIQDTLSKTKPKTLLYNFLGGRFLDRSRMLISGRPKVAASLRDVSRTVQLLGLNFTQLKEMTKKVYEDKPQITSEILEYLDSHSDILNLCTSPVNSKGVLNSIKECYIREDHKLNQDQLPTSKAALVYVMVLNLLCSNDQELSNDASLSNKNILQPHKVLLSRLADLAYNSLSQDNKQLFDFDDLIEHDLTYQDVVRSGLLIRHPSWVNEGFWGMQKVYLQFPHMIFQEFFAALKLSQLPATKLETIINMQRGEGDVVIALCLRNMIDPVCQELLTFLYPNTPINLYKDKTEHLLKVIWSAPRSLQDDGALYSLSVLNESDINSMAKELSQKLISVFKALNLLYATVSPADCRNVSKFLVQCDQLQCEPFYEVVLGGKIDHQSLTRLMKAKSFKGLTLLIDPTTEILRKFGLSLNDNSQVQQVSLYNRSADWREFRVADNASLKCLRLSGALCSSQIHDLCDLLTSFHSLEALCLQRGTLSPLILPSLPGLRYLILDGCGLVGGDMKLFADNTLVPQLVWLDVRNNKIRDKGVEILAKCLQDKKVVLEGLILQCCEITSQGIGALCRALKHRVGPKVLALTGNHINDDVDPIVSVLGHCAIKEVNVGGCNISSDGGCHILSGLAPNTSITFLEMGDKALGSTKVITSLHDALRQNKHLLGLGLPFCGLTDEMLELLASALKNNTTLQLLNIGGNPSLTSSSIVLLFTDTQLQHLCVSGCNLGMQGWREVGKALAKSPRMVSCMVGDMGNTYDLVGVVEELASFQNKGPLERLFLSARKMGDVASLVHKLRQIAPYTVNVAKTFSSWYWASGLFWQHIPTELRQWLWPVYIEVP